MCEQIQAVSADLADSLKDRIGSDPRPDLTFDRSMVRPSVYPRSEVSSFTWEDGQLALTPLKWGYEVPWSKNIFYNVWVEQAIKQAVHNMWYDSLRNRRCVIPAFGFYLPSKHGSVSDYGLGEPSGEKYLCTLTKGEICFIGAIHELGQFSVMMTEPSSVIRQFHPRMPVVLSAAEVRTWLIGDYESLFERRHIQLDAQRILQK